MVTDKIIADALGPLVAEKAKLRRELEALNASRLVQGLARQFADKAHSVAISYQLNLTADGIVPSDNSFEDGAEALQRYVDRLGTPSLNAETAGEILRCVRRDLFEEQDCIECGVPGPWDHLS